MAEERSTMTIPAQPQVQRIWLFRGRDTAGTPLWV